MNATIGVDTTFRRCTPTASELLPNFRIQCQQTNCSSTFGNAGNLELHLLKRHKIARPKTSLQSLYHCPVEDCMYHEASVDARHFKSIKYVRQHYQKVHAPKSYICAKCNRGFPSFGVLQAHITKVCERKFVCNECGWDYASREALLTHGKRKGHVVLKHTAAVTAEMPKVNIPRLPAKRAPTHTNHKFTQRNKQTQTDNEEHDKESSTKRSVCVTSVQTDPFADVTSFNGYATELEDIQSLLRDIETQTEPFTRTSPKTNPIYNIDHMLGGHSTHMHTQTCEEFLTELGLASDIQTQTNEYTSTATSTGCAHDELLVSTETQTSFTQCLLDSCSAADATAFGSLSQHTQTCETLGGFLFGSADNDFISGLQSTYTQT